MYFEDDYHKALYSSSHGFSLKLLATAPLSNQMASKYVCVGHKQLILKSHGGEAAMMSNGFEVVAKVNNLRL
nr:hypothetical protein [Tanacetum cinerariifolium]